MADFKNKVERVKNILDHKKLWLYTECPSEPTKKSSMNWMLVASNPRLIVWTNDPADTGEANGYGKIQANMDAPTFTVFLDYLNQAIESVGEVKFSVTCLGYIFPGGKRSEKPVVTSTLYCGKDKEGIVWISLVAKNRPVIKFPFGEGEFHHFFTSDGSPAAKGEISQLYAKAHIRLLYGFMEKLMVTTYVPPEPAQFNQGGFNKQGNGNSKFQESDLPF